MNKAWKSVEAVAFQPKEILPDISIVIPTLGRPILSECLYWIASADNWPAAVWIIDQGSKPEVANWVQTLQNNGMKARHISSDKRGRSAGINCGLEQVKTRFVAITDDDCFVNPDWLGRMTLALRESPEAIITGRVEAAGGGEADFCVVTSRSNLYPPTVKSPPLDWRQHGCRDGKRPTNWVF
jgi:cellulose synthase/poly-beta-1,6-N-acetylglucosamine synthase-like glycosyltransferase